jgi:hypothetical protein
MKRPSGDHLGFRFAFRGQLGIAASIRAYRVNLEAGLLTAVQDPVSFGDHEGLTLYEPLWVSLRTLLPSEFMTKIWGLPCRSETKARRELSGDHEGEISIASLLVSLASCLPSLLIR